jgi:hypothetical protein
MKSKGNNWNCLAWVDSIETSCQQEKPTPEERDKKEMNNGDLKIVLWTIQLPKQRIRKVFRRFSGINKSFDTYSKVSQI